jgi:hypothetical protein
MTTCRPLVALLLPAALAAGCASSARPSPTPAAVPEALALPADEAPALRLRASGVQVYECRAKEGAAGETEWALVAPEAELVDEHGTRVAKHYAGPTWESLSDGSKVVGKVKAHADAPGGDAIPWLLLAATSSGQGTFEGVTSVQRLETRGGKAPAGRCQPGAEPTRVPYTAVYVFARKKS